MKANAKSKAVFNKIPQEWIIDAFFSAEEEHDAVRYLDKILPLEERSIVDQSTIQLIEKIAVGD